MGLWSVAVCEVEEGGGLKLVWHSKVPLACTDSLTAGRAALRQASRGHDDTRTLRVYVQAWQGLVLERVEKVGKPG